MGNWHRNKCLFLFFFSVLVVESKQEILERLVKCGIEFVMLLYRADPDLLREAFENIARKISETFQISSPQVTERILDVDSMFEEGIRELLLGDPIFQELRHVYYIAKILFTIYVATTNMIINDVAKSGSLGHILLMDVYICAMAVAMSDATTFGASEAMIHLYKAVDDACYREAFAGRDITQLVALKHAIYDVLETIFNVRRNISDAFAKLSGMTKILSAIILKSKSAEQGREK